MNLVHFLVLVFKRKQTIERFNGGTGFNCVTFAKVICYFRKSRIQFIEPRICFIEHSMVEQEGLHQQAHAEASLPLSSTHNQDRSFHFNDLIQNLLQNYTQGFFHKAITNHQESSQSIFINSMCKHNTFNNPQVHRHLMTQNILSQISKFLIFSIYSNSV